VVKFEQIKFVELESRAWRVASDLLPEMQLAFGLVVRRRKIFCTV